MWESGNILSIRAGPPPDAFVASYQIFANHKIGRVRHLRFALASVVVVWSLSSIVGVLLSWNVAMAGIDCLRLSVVRAVVVLLVVCLAVVGVLLLLSDARKCCFSTDDDDDDKKDENPVHGLGEDGESVLNDVEVPDLDRARP